MTRGGGTPPFHPLNRALYWYPFEGIVNMSGSHKIIAIDLVVSLGERYAAKFHLSITDNILGLEGNNPTRWPS